MTPPATLDEARRLVTRFVAHYNTKRLHSAIGYVTPHDVLYGRQKGIHEARDRKLEAAREARAQRRNATREAPSEAASQAAGASPAPRQEADDSLHL